MIPYNNEFNVTSFTDNFRFLFLTWLFIVCNPAFYLWNIHSWSLLRNFNSTESDCIVPLPRCWGGCWPNWFVYRRCWHDGQCLLWRYFRQNTSVQVRMEWINGRQFRFNIKLNNSTPQGDHVGRLYLHHDRNVHLHVHAEQWLHSSCVHDIVLARILYDGLLACWFWVRCRVDLSRAWRNVVRLAECWSTSLWNLVHHAVLWNIGYVRWHLSKFTDGNFPCRRNGHYSSDQIRFETATCTRSNNSFSVNSSLKASTEPNWSARNFLFTLKHRKSYNKEWK